MLHSLKYFHSSLRNQLSVGRLDLEYPSADQLGWDSNRFSWTAWNPTTSSIWACSWWFCTARSWNQLTLSSYCSTLKSLQLNSRSSHRWYQTHPACEASTAEPISCVKNGSVKTCSIVNRSFSSQHNMLQTNHLALRPVSNWHLRNETSFEGKSNYFLSRVAKARSSQLTKIFDLTCGKHFSKTRARLCSWTFQDINKCTRQYQFFVICNET